MDQLGFGYAISMMEEMIMLEKEEEIKLIEWSKIIKITEKVIKV